MRRILFLTDLHGAHSYLPALIEREPGADLVLIGGDVTSFGSAYHARQMIEPLMDAFPVVRSVQGNVDLAGVRRWLEESGTSLHGRGELIGSLGVFGCGGSNHTPMNTPTELSEEQIKQMLEAGYEQVMSAERKVMVTHTPPVDTTLDRMFAGKHVGSTAVRNLLEARDVDLCLCGHIHEAVGVERLGGALLVNPGALCSGRYAVIEDDGACFRADLRRIQLGRLDGYRATMSGVVAKVVGYARHRLKDSSGNRSPG